MADKDHPAPVKAKPEPPKPPEKPLDAEVNDAGIESFKKRNGLL